MSQFHLLLLDVESQASSRTRFWSSTNRQ